MSLHDKSHTVSRSEWCIMFSQWQQGLKQTTHLRALCAAFTDGAQNISLAMQIICPEKFAAISELLRRAPRKSRSQHYSQGEADDELLKRERAYIENWRSKTGNTNEEGLIGLALSGGGIRSATFSLGVLQALARHDVLKYIDYISTVSGGGYIGLGLTWWLAGKTGSKETYGVDQATFPYGVADPGGPEKNPTPILTHLRKNASYLVPGGGINYLSGLAILIRAVLLNLLVWLPIAAALCVLLLVLGPIVSAHLSVTGISVDSIANPLTRLLETPENIETDWIKISYDLFYLLIWLGLGALGWYAVACVDFAFFTRLTHYLDDTKKRRQDRTPGKDFSDNYVNGPLIRWAVIVAIAAAVWLMGKFWGETLWAWLSENRRKLRCSISPSL